MKIKGPGKLPSTASDNFRGRVLLIWSVLMLAVFAAAILVLFAADFLSHTDRKIQNDLETQMGVTGPNIQQEMERVAARSLHLSTQARDEIEGLMMRTGLTFDELNDDQEHLLELQQSLYAPLSSIIQTAGCSGAYVILDVTANTAAPGARNSRSGMYLRCVNISGRNTIDPDITYFRGIPEVGREKGLEFHNRWDLEFNISGLPGYTELMEKELVRPADCYYWTERLNLRDTWEDVVLLCVPIVGNNRQVYGMCGVEISSLMFRLAAPVHEMDFGPVTTVLAPLENGKLILPEGLIGGTGGTYLDTPSQLAIHMGRSINTYIGQGSEYVGVQQIMDISQGDSEQRRWAAALLLPRASYTAYAAAQRWSLMLKCTGLLVLLLALSALLYWRFLRPFLRMEAEREKQDDLAVLIAFVRSRPVTEDFRAVELPGEIRTLMERFSKRVAGLSNEEWRLYRFLAEGCAPDTLPEHTGLDKRTLRRQLNALCEDLGVHAVEDILLYLDFFRRCGKDV